MIWSFCWKEESKADLCVFIFCFRCSSPVTYTSNFKVQLKQKKTECESLNSIIKVKDSAKAYKSQVLNKSCMKISG